MVEDDELHFKRMTVPFGELIEEIAIVSGHPLELVNEVLEHYSAACARALAEDMIVEVAEGIRLQREEYIDRRVGGRAFRLYVNPDYELTRTRAKDAKNAKLQEEHERSVHRFRKLDTGKSE